MSALDSNSQNQGKMFVGGLSPVTTEQTLKEYFEQFDEVIECTIMLDKDTKSRGFGFVVLKTPSKIDEIVVARHHIVDGKQVECKKAVPKEQQKPAQNNQNNQMNILGGGANIPQQEKKKSKNKNKNKNKLKNQQLQQQEIAQQQLSFKSSPSQNNEEQKQSSNNLNQQVNYDLQPQNYTMNQGTSQGSNQQHNFDLQSRPFVPKLSQPSQQEQLVSQEQDQQDNKKILLQRQVSPVVIAPKENINKDQQLQQQEIKQMQEDFSPNKLKKLEEDLQKDFEHLDFQQNFINQYSSKNGEFAYYEKDDVGDEEDENDLDEDKNFSQKEQWEAKYRKIFVGGLPHNLSQEEFRTYFQQYGDLEDCVILLDKRTQKPRGFGFVTYFDINCTNKVMDMKDNHQIQGKWVDCKRAVPINEMKEIKQEKLQAQQKQKNVEKDQQQMLQSQQESSQYFQNKLQMNLFNDDNLSNKSNKAENFGGPFMGNQKQESQMNTQAQQFWPSFSSQSQQYSHPMQQKSQQLQQQHQQKQQQQQQQVQNSLYEQQKYYQSLQNNNNMDQFSFQNSQIQSQTFQQQMNLQQMQYFNQNNQQLGYKQQNYYSPVSNQESNFFQQQQTQKQQQQQQMLQQDNLNFQQTQNNSNKSSSFYPQRQQNLNQPPPGLYLQKQQSQSQPQFQGELSKTASIIPFIPSQDNGQTQANNSNLINQQRIATQHNQQNDLAVQDYYKQSSQIDAPFFTPNNLKSIQEPSKAEIQFQSQYYNNRDKKIPVKQFFEEDKDAEISWAILSKRNLDLLNSKQDEETERHIESLNQDYSAFNVGDNQDRRFRKNQELDKWKHTEQFQQKMTLQHQQQLEMQQQQKYQFQQQQQQLLQQQQQQQQQLQNNNQDFYSSSLMGFYTQDGDDKKPSGGDVFQQSQFDDKKLKKDGGSRHSFTNLNLESWRETPLKTHNANNSLNVSYTENLSDNDNILLKGSKGVFIKDNLSDGWGDYDSKGYQNRGKKHILEIYDRNYQGQDKYSNKSNDGGQNDHYGPIKSQVLAPSSKRQDRAYKPF